MTKQEAMVIQDLIGGEIVESPADEYSVEIYFNGDKDLTLSLNDKGWYVVDEFGETVYSSEEIA